MSPPAAPRPSTGNRTCLILTLAIGVPCVILTVVGAWFLYNAFQVVMKDFVPMVECADRFANARAALLAYADENGGRLPDATTWQDVSAPYVESNRPAKNEEFHALDIERLPAEGDWGCRYEKKLTGMAYNADVAGKLVADLPSHAVLLFEIEEPSRNANMPYDDRPTKGAPTAFGEQREWMEIPLRGKSNFDQRFQAEFTD